MSRSVFNPSLKRTWSSLTLGTTPLVLLRGTVSFRGGKLYRASKTWAAGLIKRKGAAEGLFGVLSRVVGASGRTRRVKAETLRVAGGDRGMDVKLVTLGPDVRYVAVYKDGLLRSRERLGLTDASAGESDRYEELLVNPAVLTFGSVATSTAVAFATS